MSRYIGPKTKREANCAKFAWDYQQKEIDKLQFENTELKKKIEELEEEIFNLQCEIDEMD